MKPRHFQYFRRPKTSFVDDPSAKELRRILGHTARRQDFNVASERCFLRFPELLVLAMIVIGRDQRDEKISRRHRVGANENARGNALLRISLPPETTDLTLCVSDCCMK